MSYTNLMATRTAAFNKKGMTMSRNPLKAFAHECVVDYAKFKSEDYQLNVNDLPDFVQEEFAALIMVHDTDRAHESTGADNENFEKQMLPTLIKLLQDSTDRDEQIEFINSWKEGVTAYHKRYMQELIDNALEDYNNEQGYVIKDHHDYYGVRSLFSAR